MPATACCHLSSSSDGKRPNPEGVYRTRGYSVCKKEDGDLECEFRHRGVNGATRSLPLAKDQNSRRPFFKVAIWIRDEEVASKYSQSLSPHAVIGNAVWLRGIKPAVILDMDGQHCLVRISDEEGGWSELTWIKGHDGPIIGTPPSNEAVAWRRQILALPLSARPPLPSHEHAAKQP